MPAAALLNAILGAIPAQSDIITFNIWPRDDPESAVFCSVRLSGREIIVIQSKGLGLPGPRPYRWWASDRETAAFVLSISSLVDGRIPSQNPLFAPSPQPPFVTVTWVANVDGKVLNGRYVGHGTHVPDAFSGFLETVMPESYCQPAAK